MHSELSNIPLLCTACAVFKAVLETVESAPDSDVFDVDVYQIKMAHQFHLWRQTNPKDIGFCTDAITRFAPNVQEMRKQAVIWNAIQKEKWKPTSLGNLANGTVSRMGALIVAGMQLDAQSFYDLMCADICLTHMNCTLMAVQTALAMIIKQMALSNGTMVQRARNAIDYALEWLSKGKIVGNELIMQWIEKAACKIKPLHQLSNALHAVGYVYHSALRAIHLWFNVDVVSWEQAMTMLISEGGDVDTTAMIVGYGFGVLYGSKISNSKWWSSIRGHRSPVGSLNRGYQPRCWLTTSNVLKLCMKMPLSVTGSTHEPKEEWLKAAQNQVHQWQQNNNETASRLDVDDQKESPSDTEVIKQPPRKKPKLGD